EPEPGVVWVAARFGIFESRGNAPFRKTLDLPTGFVYAFLRGADGRFYAPTSSFGVFVHQDGEWKPAEPWNSRLPSANVRAMLWQPDGDVFIGTLGGLRVFDAEDRVATPAWRGWEEVPSSVNALLRVGDETWIGGHGGLAVCDEKKAECRRIDPAT